MIIRTQKRSAIGRVTVKDLEAHCYRSIADGRSAAGAGHRLVIDALRDLRVSRETS
jgi:hypothetical protein